MEESGWALESPLAAFAFRGSVCVVLRKSSDAVGDAVLTSLGVLGLLAALGSLGSLGVRYGEVVDCFDVRRCAQVLDAGCEAFGSGQEEVLREGLVGFRGVGGGLLAF